MQKPEIKVDSNVRLRTVAVTDANELYSIIEKDRSRLNRWLPWVNHIQSVEEEVYFIQNEIPKTNDRSLWMATIVLNERAVGVIDIHAINFDRHSGQIGYWIDQAVQGQGIMSKCLRKVVEVAKDDFNIHRLELITDVENWASQRVAEKNDFKKEGIMKEYIPHENGQYRDAVLFGRILK